MTPKQKMFIRELRDLLHKYHADIGWTCDDCSDTYGLSGDHLYISIMGQKYIDLDNNSIDEYDLNELLKNNEV